MQKFIKVPLIDGTTLSCFATAAVVYEFTLEFGSTPESGVNSKDLGSLSKNMCYIIWRSAKSAAIIQQAELRFNSPEMLMEFLSFSDLFKYGGVLLNQVNQIDEQPLLEAERKPEVEKKKVES